MPRFVILWHETPAGYARPSHWDLMLERGDALATWALQHEPSQPNGQLAEQLGDHRLEYLTYEGEISGGRGTVTRWDEGTYQTVRETATEWIVDLRGETILGQLTLTRMAHSSDQYQSVFLAAR